MHHSIVTTLASDNFIYQSTEIVKFLWKQLTAKTAPQPRIMWEMLPWSIIAVIIVMQRHRINQRHQIKLSANNKTRNTFIAFFAAVIFHFSNIYDRARQVCAP